LRPFTRTIIDLFDGKRRYLIPLYQRQYAWKVSPQLELLWEDIERSADRLEIEGDLRAPHFMGAIVIAQVKTFGKQVQAFEVIDGQQRLSTFQLLLAAFRSVAVELLPEYAAEILKHLMNDGVMETPAIEKFKLWPSLVDRAAFTKLLDPGGIGTSAEYVIEDEEGVVRPAVAAHAYFVSVIRKRLCPHGVFDTFRMEKLFEALKNGLAVVSIELEGGDDPQTIFETLNSRGVDLTAGDLMRNFIFQRAVGLGQEDGSLRADKLYQTHWLPLDKWFWREGETRGRLTRARLDWMLVDHLAMKLADLVSAESLYDSYRRWILEKNPYGTVEKELKAISASAEVNKKILEQNKDEALGRLGTFSKAFDVSTAMPLVLYLATEAELGSRLVEALSSIESYIIRRDLCGLPTNNYNRFFVDLIGKLRATSDDRIELLRQVLSAGKIDISRWPNNEELQRQWYSRPQYKAARQPRLRYIFEAIEAKKRTSTNEIVEIKTNLTLEHIMPQKWREHWALPPTVNIGGDEVDLDLIAREGTRDSKINLMGNLTLLTQALNSSVSNGPFSSKMPALRAQSALVLNRELHDFGTWDEGTISTRGADLLKVTQQIWIGPNVGVELSQNLSN
jgi:uncharacterized protein with ParB-like and HNH nuclease domain